MKKLILSTSLAILGISAFAQEPGSQPTNLSFFNIKTFGFNLSFTPAQCDGFLVLRSNAPITFTPQDGVEYQKGQGVATGVKVFASGPSSSLSIKESFAGAQYHFAIFSFNNSGSAIDYKNTNPLTGTIDIPEAGPANYYTTITGNSLAALKQRLNAGRVFQSYTPGYINNLMMNFYIRDTVGGKYVSICQYTSEVYISTPPYSWQNGTAAGIFSREHALPKSWMHTGGNTDNQDGADYHNLFPVDQDKANSKRSNYPYGIVQNITYQFLEGKFGTNSQGITVYEPRNSIKGDVARAQFYMMVANNGNSGTWGYTTMPTYAQQQSQDLLKTWHDQDPPDDFERTRHEYIFSVQNNRNPFIDFPELADCINFNTLTLYSGCVVTLGTDEFENPLAVNIYPNPTSDILYFNNPGESLLEVYVTDLNGKVLLAENFGNLSPETTIEMNVSMLSSGIYFMHFRSGSKSSNQKLIINR